MTYCNEKQMPCEWAQIGGRCSVSACRKMLFTAGGWPVPTKQPEFVKLPMTNADRIRAMSDDEMADFLDRVQEEECNALHEVRQDGTHKFASLRNGWLAWLQQPAEEVDHSERNLVAVRVKHTEYRWKFGMPCVLWGHRTKDDEKRSFGGYTQYPNNAEVYSLKDWAQSGYANDEWMKIDEPVHMCIDFCKKYKKYDTVLVPLDEYIGYCKMACLPLDRPQED